MRRASVLADNTQLFDYALPQLHRAHPAPHYPEERNPESRIPDFRHTLLWEPALPTEGRTSLTLPFFTSDQTGVFWITVEALTPQGEVIQWKEQFEVDSN